VDAQARTAMQKITNAFTDRPCSGPISSVNSKPRQVLLVSANSTLRSSLD